MNSAQEREQVLLSYVPMCYSVALALTREPHEARDLTREVVTRAWHFADVANGRSSIKMNLLTSLRERFLQGYCRLECGSECQEALAERIQRVLSTV